jgi:hypothetical protein
MKVQSAWFSDLYNTKYYYLFYIYVCVTSYCNLQHMHNAVKFRSESLKCYYCVIKGCFFMYFYSAWLWVLVKAETCCKYVIHCLYSSV